MRQFDPNPPACPSCGRPGIEMDVWGDPLGEFTCDVCGWYELTFDRAEWTYRPFANVRENEGLIQRGPMDGECRPSTQLYGFIRWLDAEGHFAATRMTAKRGHWVATLAEALTP